jgi:DNA gyrase subunit A
MLVTRAGVINRQHASEIRVIGRNTQGVRLVSLDEGDEVVDVARILVDLSDVDSEGGEVLAGTPEADPDVGEEAAAERAES